jgi:SAM-dependent methyltransferase
MLKLLSADDGRRFREFLTESGFCREEHRGTLLLRELPSPRRRNLPRLLYHTREKTPLNVLLRWFVIGVPVEASVATEVLPEWMLELGVQHGLLGRREEMLVPLVRLTIWGDRIFASDNAAKMESEDSAGVVIWPNNTTNHLARFTIRRRFTDVLDLGTGCGVQAILAAEHSDRVVATDINPRATECAAFNARLNGVENIEFLTGDTFETVGDRKFDLIVTNPPFFLSPVARHVFCDSGMELDQYCRRVIREASLHLKDGGFLQMMLEWVTVKSQSWQDRVSEWFEGTGCDAWLWREYGHQADQYAQNRIRETTAYSADGDQAAFDEWIAYYRENGVEEVHGGRLSMRRRSGKNWTRIDEMPADPEEPLGDAIVKGFAARDFLEAHSNDEALLATAPLLSPDAELEQRLRHSGSGWEMISLSLSVKRGIPASVATDPMVADFLGKCDGKRTLESLIQDLSSKTGASNEQARLECLRLVRRLTELGFMTV